ncbi:MAG: hypothetical protein K5891_09380, partial [Lachnospiraceae bacterium]|nr:hypothetical protein [Lachnospiraceae bacterium]
MLNARVSVQLQRVIGLPKERDLLGDLAGGLGVAFCAVMGAAPEQGFVTFSVLFSLTWLFLLELLKRFGGGSNGLLRKVSASLAPFCQMGRYWPVFFFVSLVSGQETSRWWQSIYVSGWGMSGILRAIYVFFAGNLLLLLLECIGRLFGLGDAASSGADPGSEGPLSILRLSGRDAMLGEILALVIFGALFLRRFFDTSMITELAQVLGWWDQIEKITRILFRVGMCVGILSLGALAESAVRSGEGKAASPADAQKQVKEHAALAL